MFNFIIFRKQFKFKLTFLLVCFILLVIISCQSNRNITKKDKSIGKDKSIEKDLKVTSENDTTNNKKDKSIEKDLKVISKNDITNKKEIATKKEYSLLDLEKHIWIKNKNGTSFTKGKTYIVKSNVTINKVLGSYNYPFQGTLIGKKSLKKENLSTIEISLTNHNSYNTYQGLFSTLSNGANIKNIKLVFKEVKLLGMKEFGGIAGIVYKIKSKEKENNQSNILIENVHVNFQKSPEIITDSYLYAGGLIGSIKGNEVEVLVEKTSVIGNLELAYINVAGFIGRIENEANISIKQSFFKGSLTSIDTKFLSAGGLIGIIESNNNLQKNNSLFIEDSYVKLEKLQSFYAGGMIGMIGNYARHEGDPLDNNVANYSIIIKRSYIWFEKNSKGKKDFFQCQANIKCGIGGVIGYLGLREKGQIIFKDIFYRNQDYYKKYQILGRSKVTSIRIPTLYAFAKGYCELVDQCDELNKISNENGIKKLTKRFTKFANWKVKTITNNQKSYEKRLPILKNNIE